VHGSQIKMLVDEDVHREIELLFDFLDTGGGTFPCYHQRRRRYGGLEIAQELGDVRSHFRQGVLLGVVPARRSSTGCALVVRY